MRQQVHLRCGDTHTVCIFDVERPLKCGYTLRRKGDDRWWTVVDASPAPLTVFQGWNNNI